MPHFLQRPLLLLAVYGLLASVSVHALSLFSLAMPLWLVIALHAGVLILALSALRVARPAFRGRPGCWQVCLVLLFAYGAVNLYLAAGALLADLNHPAQLLGWVPAVWARAFSGFWMFFYAADVAAFFPLLSPHPGAAHTHRCPFGHLVPPGAELCPICEWRVERE